VLRLRGIIPRETKWDVVVDLFFYREPEEAEKEEQAAKEAVVVKPEVVPHEPQDLEWTTMETQDWTATEPPAAVPVPAAGAGGAPPFQPAATDDWAAQVQEEWGANATATQPAQPNWGSSASEWH
jgi:small subunit ribosomal protein SAe